MRYGGGLVLGRGEFVSSPMEDAGVDGLSDVAHFSPALLRFEMPGTEQEG